MAIHMMCTKKSWLWNLHLVKILPSPDLYLYRQKDALRVGLGILVFYSFKEANSQEGGFVGSNAKGMSWESAPSSQQTVPVNFKF